jgi:hypothetical protein
MAALTAVFKNLKRKAGPQPNAYTKAWLLSFNKM